MFHYLTKIALTTVLVVAISEVTKRNNFLGALLASIPIVSILALIWLYNDTQNIIMVSTLSRSIFWLVLPSLSLFITLPILLDHGINFYFSLIISIVITICCYWGIVTILHYYNIKL